MRVPGKFWEEVEDLTKSGRGKNAVRTHCCLYLTAEDEELKGLSNQRLEYARSFEEFVRTFGQVEPMHDVCDAG